MVDLGTWRIVCPLGDFGIAHGVSKRTNLSRDEKERLLKEQIRELHKGIELPNDVAMFCPVGNDEICILDPAGHYTTNFGYPYYNLASEDIRQKVNSWLSYMGGNRQVFMVFSDDSCHTFSGTEDFITWMYNR